MRTSNLRETADAYDFVVARIDQRHRLIVCGDGIQWIVQKTDGTRDGRPRWKSTGFCRTKNALRRCLSGLDEMVVAQVIDDLPETFRWSR
jgi:hypothetical protein